MDLHSTLLSSSRYFCFSKIFSEEFEKYENSIFETYMEMEILQMTFLINLFN